MTLVGNPEVVAVELVAGPAGFCGMRLWLNRQAVGDPELYGPAGALAEGLSRFRARESKRVDPSLFSASASTCLDAVGDALFGPSRGLRSSVLDLQRYGAFLLSPNLCESLDDYLIIVVSDASQQRVLSRSYIDGTVVEVGAPASTIESVFEATELRLARWSGEAAP